MNETITIVNNLPPVSLFWELVKIIGTLFVGIILGFLVATINHKFDIKKLRYEKFFNKKIEYVEKVYLLINEKINLYNKLLASIMIQEKYPSKKIDKEIDKIKTDLQKIEFPEVNQYELYLENQEALKTMARLNLIEKIDKNITKEDIKRKKDELEKLLKLFGKEIGKRKTIIPPSRLTMGHLMTRKEKSILKKLDKEFRENKSA